MYANEKTPNGAFHNPGNTLPNVCYRFTGVRFAHPVGLEPTTHYFGDSRSTIELRI